MDQIKEILTSFFYELARDHVTIGRLNNVLTQTVPHKKTTFTDKKLAEWAEAFAEQLIKDKLSIDMPKNKKEISACTVCDTGFYSGHTP